MTINYRFISPRSLNLAINNSRGAVVEHMAVDTL